MYPAKQISSTKNYCKSATRFLGLKYTNWDQEIKQKYLISIIFSDSMNVNSNKLRQKMLIKH